MAKASAPAASRVAKVSARGLSGPYDWVKCSFGFVSKPYRATAMSNLRIGHVIGRITLRCGHGRRCADEDVECDVSGRIIFGPDNAYLRDQSPQRFQSQRGTRRSVDVQGFARRHLHKAVGQWHIMGVSDTCPVSFHPRPPHRSPQNRREPGLSATLLLAFIAV
jgi:hypothetical protein